MSSDLCIPVSGKLDNLKELYNTLEQGIEEFRLITPSISLTSIVEYDINKNVLISYSEDVFCRFSIDKFDKEMTEHEVFEHLCIITSRKSWSLAYVVAYCFIKKINLMQ